MSDDFVPTRASLLQGKAQKHYQEITYISYKPKKKQKESEEKSDEKQEKASDLEFNMKKAKHEIVKFGMSGFDPLKKEEAKIQQLIKLGAKPPKSKYKNYKQLIKDKKVESQKQAKEQKLQQLGKNQAGKSTAKGKSFDRKRRKEGILDIYGKILKEKARTERKV